jgi:alpha-galactosidase
MKDSALEYSVENRGEEHGSFIIEGLETGRVYRGHFNTVNNGVISNLPEDAIIEAPGYVDRNGISMLLVGELPLGLAAVCNVSISVQRLAVEAAVHGDDKLLRQAFMMDPLVGAVCNPKEIWQMVDEMLVAGEQWLPQYSEAIAKAKERLAAGNLIPTKTNNEGAARLKVKTVEEMMLDRDAANKNAGESDKGKDREKAH